MRETAPPRRRYATRLPREERRELILDAAMRVIARDGFAAATFARVAEEAQIAKSVLYGIFEDPETLQHELMQREQERAFSLAARALAAGQEGDFADGLREGLLVFLGGVAANPASWQVVVQPRAGTPEKVARAIREGRERWRRALEPIVTERMRALGIDGVDAELLAHLVRGNAEYLAQLIIDHPDRFTHDRIAAFITSLVGQAARLAA